MRLHCVVPVGVNVVQVIASTDTGHAKIEANTIKLASSDTTQWGNEMASALPLLPF